MEAGSEGENNMNNDSSSPIESPKKPKRQMKTPYQLEILEKTYASETYPSESTRSELSEKLGLTDRQLQMWFCHRRLKDKKDGAVKPPQVAGTAGKRKLFDSPADELVAAEGGSDHGSGSESGSSSGSGDASHFNYGNDVQMARRYYESPEAVMVRRAIACVEAQIGEPLREDGPIIGMEFDEPPPGAFGAPIVMAEQQDRSRNSCDHRSFEQRDIKLNNAALRGPHEYAREEPSIGPDAYRRHIPSNFYDPVDYPGANFSLYLHENGQLRRGYRVQGHVSLPSPHGRPGHFSSPSWDNYYIAQKESLVNTQMDAPTSPHPLVESVKRGAYERHVNSEDGLGMDRKRKSEEARIGRQVEANENWIQKELEKPDVLRRKREEQMRREMEKQERERRKEEEKIMREKQRQEERFQREERREIERREKYLQKESLIAERKRQKEELRKEKEAARQKAALERAAARKIARESMELIEDERLELMELAASRKGLPAITSLDHDTLQNLELFRDFSSPFPPKSVQLKRPFAIKPWIDSDENIGNLLMVWRFCITFADVLGLWPFTLDELVQAFHDYDSRLLGEIHIAVLKLIIKDIEDVARTPSAAVGTNQFAAANPEGGHLQIVEGAYLWGFDICNWKNHLNPMTWPEILRQFALSAGFGPQLTKSGVERTCFPDDEVKGCEDVVSTIRNGSAAENAVALMQEKGFPLQRRSRHRLTPGTVKFAAYHVLSLEGSKGLTALELAHKIQECGLRDLTTSKTPEASISVALSRDTVLFERTAPSTYRVRTPFRKDPADAEAILSAAIEKIKRYENGFSAEGNAGDVEKDEDSEGEGAEGPEVDDLVTSDIKKDTSSQTDFSMSYANGKDNLSNYSMANLRDDLDAAGTPVNEPFEASGNHNIPNNPDQGCTEIDESKSGEPWVQGLTEGEYSDLSVEERLNAFVALVGIVNEGNSICSVLEDRLDAANALKKQMWAEAQLDKKGIKEGISKSHHTSFMGNEDATKQACSAPKSSQSPFATVDNKIFELPLSTAIKKEPSTRADDIQEHLNNTPPDGLAVLSYSIGQTLHGHAAERSRLLLKSYIGHRAEATYVYRSLPLGQDRRRNRYWKFGASAAIHDPGSGRIFVESPSGHWRVIDSKEAFDTLLASLDARGIRESHLHIMLQDIERSFKENVRRNSLYADKLVKCGNAINEGAEMDSSPACSHGVDSPQSIVSGSNSTTFEPSSSFRVGLWKNEAEKKASLNRYQEFQLWMWREGFNSSSLCAMKYGKKRCRPVLGICGFCLDLYLVSDDLCPSCHRSFDSSFTHGEDQRKVNFSMSNSSKFSQPLRIRLLKALLTFIEFSLPPEALQPSWAEDHRKTWGMQLHDSSSLEDLLQALTELEAVIKRDYLSTNYETTEELLASYALLGYDASNSGNPGPVLLPWMPLTTAAVVLRLLELDGSIYYLPDLKGMIDNSKGTEDNLLQSGHLSVEDVEAEPLEVRRGEHAQEKITTVVPNSRGAHRRIFGKSQRRVAKSGRRRVIDKQTLAQVLMQQIHGTQEQRMGRGPRTVRRRRTDKKFIKQRALDHPGNNCRPGDGDKPQRNSSEEDIGNEIQEMQIVDADDASSSEAAESDDNGHSVGYGREKWGADFHIAPNLMTGKSTITRDDDTGGSEDADAFEENVQLNEDMMDSDADENNGSNSEDSGRL